MNDNNNNNYYDNQSRGFYSSELSAFDAVILNIKKEFEAVCSSVNKKSSLQTVQPRKNLKFAPGYGPRLRLRLSLKKDDKNLFDKICKEFYQKLESEGSFANLQQLLKEFFKTPIKLSLVNQENKFVDLTVGHVFMILGNYKFFCFDYSGTPKIKEFCVVEKQLDQMLED